MMTACLFGIFLVKQEKKFEYGLERKFKQKGVGMGENERSIGGKEVHQWKIK